MISTNQQPDIECGRVDWLGCHRHETDSTFLVFHRQTLVCVGTQHHFKYPLRYKMQSAVLPYHTFHVSLLIQYSIYSTSFRVGLVLHRWGCFVAPLFP